MSEISSPIQSHLAPTHETLSRTQRAEQRRKDSSLPRRVMRVVNSALLAAEGRMTSGVAYANKSTPPVLADDGNIDYALHVANNSGLHVTVHEKLPEEIVDFRNPTGRS